MTTTQQPRARHADTASLVEAARGLVGTGRRHLLGITGTPGAGKSTVCAALLAELGDDAVLVGMDGFHLSNRQLRRLGRAGRKGAPDTFDVAGYAAMLQRVRDADHDVYAPVFDRSIEESIAAAAVVPADVPLVITEGNYLLLEDHGWDAVRGLLDTVWYLDVAADARGRRHTARRPGHGPAAAAAAGVRRAVDEPNARLVEGTRSRADLVLDLGTATTSEGAGA